MAGFEYQGFVNPYTPTIGELLLHGNDPAMRAAENIAAANAHALEVKGQAWGQAAREVGSIGANLFPQMQQMRDQEQMRQLHAAEVTKANLETGQMQRAQQGPQLLGKLIQQHSTVDDYGVPTINHQAVAADLSANGFPDAAEKWLATTTANAENLDKLKDLRRKTGEATASAIGLSARDATNPGDFQTRIGHLAVEGAIDPAIVKTIQADLQQAGPDGWEALKKQYVDRAAQLAKPIELPRAGAMAINPVSHTTIAESATPPKAEANVVFKDAQGIEHPVMEQNGKYLFNGQDVTNKVTRPTTEKNPPSLEEQYLLKKSAGDETGAAAILDAMQKTAAAKRDPTATAQLEAIRNLSQQEAQARLEDHDVKSDKNQQKFEQEYRTVLQRGLSSRSGGLGLEDAKVQQANHLTALMDQNFDPKTGAYNIPQVQYQELALGLARLVSPGGQVGEGMKNDLVQATLAGDVKKMGTYLSGHPFNGSTQDVFQMLRDSIHRQGTVAEQNREGEMRYLRGLAPTDLSEDRRQKLEATSLNPLRQSRVIELKTGQRVLQTSLDGGQTWK